MAPGIPSIYPTPTGGFQVWGMVVKKPWVFLLKMILFGVFLGVPPESRLFSWSCETCCCRKKWLIPFRSAILKTSQEIPTTVFCLDDTTGWSKPKLYKGLYDNLWFIFIYRLTKTSTSWKVRRGVFFNTLTLGVNHERVTLTETHMSNETILRCLGYIGDDKLHS